MQLTTHEPGFESLDTLSDLEALCVFVGEDERPLRGIAGYLDWRMCGGLSRVLVSEFFQGAAGDCLLLPSHGRIAIPRVFVCGMGPLQGAREQLGSLMTAAADRLTRAKVRSVALELPQLPGLDETERVRVIRERFLPKFKGDRVAVLADKSVSRLLPST
ncbi:MAG: peptidase M17 [Myxococcota bacterium]|nr:peptidase M17 [Myxococcota bacterium]